MKRKGRATDFDVKLGALVRKVRKHKGLSQMELAGYLGITYQQLQKLESGANRFCVERLYDTAKVFDVDVNDLLPEKE